ncbi:MAG: metallophosphoesterase family protein [Candidatus Hydrogenedentes bacterium]|nr:metallophosphoesterase family protein [Candidatus Hydrogenedentota bacterium]
MYRIGNQRIAAPILAFVSLVVLASFLGCGPYRPDVQGPFNVYLTLPDDTSHGMVVNYHTLPPAANSEVRYDTVSRAGTADTYSSHTEGTPQAFTYVPDGRLVHCVRLQALAPATTYYFVVGDAKSGYSKEYKFRTLPEHSEGLTFVNGGDMGTSDAAKTLLKLAAAREPWFAIVGGDLSYASRAPSGAKEWDHWFRNWSECMVTPQGYSIPIVTTVGNHELKDQPASPAFDDRSPFYWRFFGHQGEHPYFSRKIGDAAFVFLDSGNLVPHEGAQTEWLAAELAKYKDAPVKFAVYHQPLYPSYRDFEGDSAAVGRKLWEPLFDQYRVAAAFEHHDHTFKRSKRIKNNEVNPEGTLYLGDGCFGQKPRKVDGKPRWYLEKSSSTAHFWLVNQTKDTLRFQAINTEGKVFDECTLPVAPDAPVSNAPAAAAAQPVQQPETAGAAK